MADANLPARAGTSKSTGLASGHVHLAKRKRGDQWYLRYRMPSGRQVQKRLGPAWSERSRPPAGFFTKKMASEALAALLTDIRRGQIPDPGERVGRSFADAVAAWLHFVEHDKARRPSTIRGYRQVGRLLEAQFGPDTPIEDVNLAERIDDYRTSLLADENLSRRTAQLRLVLLRGVLQRAKRNGWIPDNAADDVERINLLRSTEFNVLTVEQVHAVAANAGADLDEAEAAMYRAAILVAAYTGLRTGELRALRWRDVDFPGASIQVIRNLPIGGEEGAPKSGKGRSVPLIDQAARALDGLSRRERFTEPDDRVFPSGVGGMLGDDALRDALYAAMAAAGIDRKSFPAKSGFVFHDLRHTFGTLGAQVFPLHDLQAFMGHAQIGTTMIYAHSVPKNDDARRFTEAVRRASGEEVEQPASAVAA